MHRWFFADDCIKYKEPTPSNTPPSSPDTPSASSLADTAWTFKVEFKGKLCDHETVAVCGSADVLGKWNVQQCLALNKMEDTSLWTMEVTLPRTYDVSYRYLICTTSGCGCQRIVRVWETHKWPRIIRRHDEQDSESFSYDIFGVNNCVNKLERGWIRGEAMVVQFKFCRAPFVYKTQTLKKSLLLYVKITPIKVKPREKRQKDLDPKLKYTPSIESQVVAENGDKDQDLRTTFAFCEVASLREKQRGFHDQPKYGTPCGPEEMLMFHLALSNVETTAYLIDLYSYPLKAGDDIPPYHFGYQYVMPQQLKGSAGTLKLNIICATRHRSIGSMECDFLLVKPLPSHDFNLKEPHNFELNGSTLDIGHRGCGKSFWVRENILRENTEHSFNMAFEHGADMVQFAVHLTKDRIPIIYHDHQLYISREIYVDNKEYDVMKIPLDAEEISSLKQFGRELEPGQISLPLSKFTLKQLRGVQVYKIPDGIPRATPCPLDVKMNMPFPTLQHVLKKISPQLGFNIEIKWSQKNTRGAWEEHFTHDMDKNDYIDTILDVVLNKAGSRRIIFSSFDADVCTLVRLKQNRYPVMFICHATAYEPKFVDPRGDSLLTSSYFVCAMELLGIIADAGDILKSPGQISNQHERNIRIFVWGSDTRNQKCRKSLKDLGVDGVIFDRINHVLDVVDLKQNVFQIELRDMV